VSETFAQKSMTPIPLNGLSTADSQSIKSKIKGLCFDIDDTFSSHGKITAEAFQALWNLKNAGIKLIPVTGRPAGWCDHIARFWPVDAVVGENGAFTLYMEGGKLKRFNTLNPTDNTAAISKLAALRKTLETEFPGMSYASDQAYREFDLAIDFCEDVPAWADSEVQRLVKVCEREGAIAKISSIHVNTWFGQYTKIEGIRKFLASDAAKTLGLPAMNQLIFAGDSPNDEPMFAAFEESVGVANVRKFLAQMKHPPKYITSQEMGAGFAELARFLQM
jgi:HAD superfamily hydrolase (TIGR01484 family)